MSVEIHTTTREDLKPNPVHDAITAIFYSIANDVPVIYDKPQLINGIIIVEQDQNEFVASDCSADEIQLRRNLLARCGFGGDGLEITYANSEIDLLLKFSELVQKHDPDMIAGYEVKMLSWGYILQRADVLNLNVAVALSRLSTSSKRLEESSHIPPDADMSGYEPEVVLPGRITLNLWMILRKEVTLNYYSYENVHYHVLHQRIPYYSFKDLTQMFNSDLTRIKVIYYYIIRSQGNLKLLEKLNLINKTSELSRIFGIQFEEVFTRGSQFRVESMMIRGAKPMFVPMSPNPKQRSKMKGPECVQLILEPESLVYSEPVAVLDFQSLYPSMIIAYNYCFSTCLGKADSVLSRISPFDFGCHELNLDQEHLKKLSVKDQLHISPNGSMFVTANCRRGVLPEMLNSILTTRILVKNAIKENNKQEVPNKALDRLLDSRQLALKLIANVTYGYTAAFFSGRMPCVEVADAIVSKGRETLERAIDFVNSNFDRWGGQVIYGDTDSLFVLFPGCSKSDAFKRAEEIASEVTAMNPKPVKLKFEKIYLPCALQTKKRYVGYMYETIDQKEPVYDAKGIETVRRDGCPFVVKLLEKSIRILFEGKNMSYLQSYLEQQFEKITYGRISTLQDFIFAKKYRGKENYRPRACVPVLKIANQLVARDPRAEPRPKERVPYVVVCGAPNQPIINLVRQPLEVIENPTLKLNSAYYIERVIIPPLNRIMNMLSINVMDWYKAMPRRNTYQRTDYLYAQKSGKMTAITHFFPSSNCILCPKPIKINGLCEDCLSDKTTTSFKIIGQIKDLEKKFSAVNLICKNCHQSRENDCLSIDCPNLFRYTQAKLDLLAIPSLNNVLRFLKANRNTSSNT